MLENFHQVLQEPLHAIDDAVVGGSVALGFVQRSKCGMCALPEGTMLKRQLMQYVVIRPCCHNNFTSASALRKVSSFAATNTREMPAWQQKPSV